MLIDTHAHLDFPEFASDLPEVLERARLAGVERVISVGTDIAASRRAVQLAERFPGVYASIGWHPCHVADAPDDIQPELRVLAGHPKVVALGECGLDYYRLPSSMGGTLEEDSRAKERQKRAFRQQLELAAATGLNMIIHTRDSFADTIELFTPFAGQVRGVFHCFIGTSAQMVEVVRLGSLVSFTGIATFKNATGVRETLKATPDECYLLETDAPFLAPVPYRGRRCEPAYVAELANLVADLRGISVEQLTSTTTANARRFFRQLV